jgi:arylsulfatase A-like enzyme
MRQMEKTGDSRARWAMRWLLGGLIWMESLFIAESIDSAILIHDSMEHVQTDPETRDLLIGGVLQYVIQVQSVYLLMGVLTGVLMALVSRVWFPTPPTARTWWRTMVGFAGITTAIGLLRQARKLPTLHDWMKVFLNIWIDSAEFWMIDGSIVLLLLLGLGLAWRRWSAHGGVTALLPRLIALVAWLLALAVLLSHPRSAGPQQDNAGPNVVLLGIDALRPDHLDSEGYFRDTAPHIDALLAESVIFEQAFTPMARTYPSWTSLLTASWPTTHQVRDNLPTPDELVPDLPMLPVLMSEAGYETGFITDDSRFSYMVPETGFSRIVQPAVGIQNFAVSVNEPRYRTFHSLMHNPIGFTMVPVMAYNQAFGKSYRPWLFEERVMDELAELSQADRFLAALHSCVLHAPGDRIDPWFRMYGQKGYQGKNRLRYSQSGTSQVYVEDDGEYDNLTAEQDVRIYDSGIDMADALVARVMDGLRQADLLDNTIIVLFSDHGENMWAPDLPYRYRGPNHGFHPYDDGQHQVMLAIRFPDGAHAGQRVTDTVRLIDVAPTIAEILGLEWPGEPDGRSMMPLIRGEHEDEQRLVYIETGLSEKNYWQRGHRQYPFSRVSERYQIDPDTGLVSIRPEFRPQLIAAKDRVIQRGQWKLVWRPSRDGLPEVELFDRSVDPHNSNNVYGRNIQIAAELGLELEPFVVGDGEDGAMFETWRRILAAIESGEHRPMRPQIP